MDGLLVSTDGGCDMNATYDELLDRWIDSDDVEVIPSVGTICRTSDGEYFYSVQEAVWHLADMGGGSILMTEHTDICLALEFPQDFCDYRLYFQFLNVDFVFNYGNIYDDCTPNGEGINGYAYYADLYMLDSIGGLGDTKIWMIGGNEGFDEPGCYVILDEFNEDPDYYYNYNFVLEKNLDAWPGLPYGEYLPEE